jgi:membrane-associated phospholipid phosphatase
VNVDPIPANILPVHDLLTESLATAGDGHGTLEYGFAFFPRLGRFDAPVFGVVTRGGESTTLTYRMLQALAEQPLWISGRVLASVREAHAFRLARVAPTGLADQPVLHLVLTTWIGPTPDDRDRTAPLETTLYAGDLDAPLLFLTPSRPQGWPL